jgi:PAS domain S-box-containing protein
MIEKPNNDSDEITELVSELNVLKRQNIELSQSGFELISAQTKLHSLLHNASDGIITFAADGKVETFNIAAQHIFGYSEVEIVTRKIPDLIPCPDWVEENVGAYIRYFISSRAAADIPLLGKHRMGFDILLHVSTGQASDHNTVLFDSDDPDSGIDPFADDSNEDNSDTTDNDVIVCFFRDITLDKKLEKELEDHKHALDLAAGVIMRDKDFRVIDINDNFCHMLGRNRNEFIGVQYIQSKLDGLSTNELQLKQKREFLSQGNSWVGESCFLNIQNQPTWFTESATPFVDENNIPYQYLSILINITDRKRFESQLEQHRDHLQDLVDEQINDIRHAKDSAEIANKAKSEFLANMSHELRTPMHGILSFTHLCLKQFKSLPLDEKQIEKLQKFLSNIETSSQRLLSLLNNLLDLSKLESGKEEFNLEKNDLYELIQQITDEYLAKIQEKQINFIINQPADPLLVLCDKSKILQVLSNLIANAIKFSPENKPITVTIENADIVLGKRATDKEKTEGVLLSIIDQGLGIPDEELATVFDKFIQSSKTKSGAGGTGLGLSISQEIIDAHNGKIWAEHNPQGGAIFKLFLPHIQPY